MRKATLCLLISGNPTTHVLLGFKKIGFGQGKYSGFGGKIEPHESIKIAAIRELAEEARVLASEEHLLYMGLLDFIFPAQPSWDQQVHVFVIKEWSGQARESKEMRPTWFKKEAIPYRQMWKDGIFWLPLILWGWRIQCRFTFHADNESVNRAEINVLDNNLTDRYNNGALGYQSRLGRDSSVGRAHD